jgi:DNA polymerase
MQHEPKSLDDELRDLVDALREHVLWHKGCGATGLARAERLDCNESAKESVQQTVSAPLREPTVQVQPSPQRRELTVRRAASIEERAKRLAALDATVRTCERCPLHQGRTKTVFGIGKPGVDIMIIGEGPGAEEDVQGEPFVGPAGQLLDRMLGAMGYGRDETYIANIVKCRPPSNRAPELEEMEACMPYLQEQIELVAPRVIVAMGATAVRGLLGLTGITRLRGKWKLYRAKIPVMPTFHPAYLLRNEAAKREAWADLKAVLKHLGREVPRPGR